VRNPQNESLLAGLRQQYDNDTALLEHMDREHSKLRAEHEELEAEYDTTSKQLGKALVDLAMSEAKVQDLRAEIERLRDQLVSPDPNEACAAHDAHLGQPCPDRTVTRPSDQAGGA
jgi:seryl-tRNA synthetase